MITILLVPVFIILWLITMYSMIRGSILQKQFVRRLRRSYPEIRCTINESSRVQIIGILSIIKFDSYLKYRKCWDQKIDLVSFNKIADDKTKKMLALLIKLTMSSVRLWLLMMLTLSASIILSKFS